LAGVADQQPTRTAYIAALSARHACRRRLVSSAPARRVRRAGGNAAAVAELNEQIEESKVHAAQFTATLLKAQKRFAALAKVEERHANHYQAQLDKVKTAA
jgi:rubrerythrin